MATTDILLDSQNINAIASDGLFSFSVNETDAPITLQPSQATLQLGGAANTAGQVSLLDGDGSPLVTLSSDSAGATGNDQNAVAIGVQDNAGRIDLARLVPEAEEREVTLQLDADMAQINLGSDAHAGRIYLNGGSEGARNAIALNGAESRITLGGSEGIAPSDDANKVAGNISLLDTQNDQGAFLNGGDQANGLGGSLSLAYQGKEALALTAGEENQGGKVVLRNLDESTTVDLDAGAATLRLGWSLPVQLNTTLSPSALPAGMSADAAKPIRGKLLLDDGAGSTYEVSADNGSISIGAQEGQSSQIGFVLKPNDGIFRIVDGNGKAVFQVDTKNGTVGFAENYSQGAV